MRIIFKRSIDVDYMYSLRHVELNIYNRNKILWRRKKASVFLFLSICLVYSIYYKTCDDARIINIRNAYVYYKRPLISSKYILFVFSFIFYDYYSRCYLGFLCICSSWLYIKMSSLYIRRLQRGIKIKLYIIMSIVYTHTKTQHPIYTTFI